MLNLLLSCASIACAAVMLAGVAFAQPSTPAEDGQWTMPAKDFENTRYSGLDQIRIGNAKDLRVAWTFSTGLTKGHEAARIVAGDTMIMFTPYPKFLYRFD